MRSIVAAVLVVVVAGCAGSSPAVKKQLRAYAAEAAERTSPDGEFSERLNRVCASTLTCTLSEVQLKHCASLKASVAADHQAALRLLQEVEP